MTQTYRLNARPKRRASRICNLQIRHTQPLLLSQQMRRKGLLRDSPPDLIPHLIHHIRVELDVVLSLAQHLCLPRRQHTRDVLHDRVPLHRKLARDIRLNQPLHRLRIASHDLIRHDILHPAPVRDRDNHRRGIPLQMPSVRHRLRQQLMHQHLALQILNRPVRLAAPLHEPAMQQLPPSPPERRVRRHESAQTIRQQLAAHDEAGARRVDGAALFEEVPCGLSGAEDDGGGWAELDVDDVAVFFAELLEPEPRLADAGFEGFGAGGEIATVRVEFPFLDVL